MQTLSIPVGTNDVASAQSGPLSEIRQLVLSDCRAEANRFGPGFFDEHLVIVADFALRLAPLFRADPLVVQLAAWLHDRSAILDFGTLATHALDGARLARELLTSVGTRTAVIDGVCRCIETHSSIVLPDDASPEQRCIASADLMSQIVNPSYWLYYLYRIRALDLESARGWYRQRLELSELLAPAARELIAEPLCCLKYVLSYAANADARAEEG